MDGATPLPADVNRGPEILGVCGAMVGLALVFVVLRVYVRVAIIRQLGWDDYCMIVAMAVMFAEMMVIIPQVGYGAGRHVEFIEPKSNVVEGLRLNFVTQPLCLIALCLTKVSVGLFLLRMTPSARFRKFILGVMVFTVLSATGNLPYAWDISIPNGRCIPPAHLKFAAFFNSSVSVVTDFIFAVLPVPILWNVQLNWKVKSAVAAILSLGILTTVEICTAIVAACIPCLKPLFKAMLRGSSADKYPTGYKIRSGYTRNNTTDLDTRPPRSDFGNIELFTRASTIHEIHGGFGLKSGSEESIIHQKDLGGDGIVKTVNISVSVDEERKKPKEVL
ncbi:conserved hypothetical protein [Verticillium alfalfae VaMs.102]|uniref:Rhodopsin domain-containing protein n=1 Tax=Verticillium alfalfae (strain VaMs.102 / ATCC MYA-4576 / FGSC 10136) TaxID=526221 RepID=C9SBK5_VERA1|nr:conserved hypothetical protein [Verticillium alfalfae VaMs.102]EEY15739.1 conserved hypothetical protein [Verticillium alfalfae VaMs.102]